MTNQEIVKELRAIAAAVADTTQFAVVSTHRMSLEAVQSRIVALIAQIEPAPIGATTAPKAMPATASPTTKK